MKPTHKGLVIMLILFGPAASIQAQQRPFYTQYVLNPFISNPALAGIENYWDLKLSYRNQWLGINGGPQTLYMSVHGPLKKSMLNKGTTGTISPPGKKNPSANAYWKQYKPATPHAGLGFTVMSDRAGPIDWYAVNAAYAYHIGITSKTSLSAGLTAGVQGIRVHTDEINFGPANPNDPSLGTDNVASKIRPDLGIGLWLYSAFYFVGISSEHIAPFKVSFSQDNTAQTYGLSVPHTTITGGYKFFMNKDINFLPSVMVRYVQNTPLSFDINAKFQYQDITWFGISYRHTKSLAAMLGVNINSTINLGYSYDIAYSRMQNVTQGTHEVVIGILLGNRNRVLCPRDFW